MFLLSIAVLVVLVLVVLTYSDRWGIGPGRFALVCLAALGLAIAASIIWPEEYEEDPTPPQVCQSRGGVADIDAGRSSWWVTCRDGYATDDVNLTP